MSKNREYSDLVLSGVLPDSPLVPLDDKFVNKNGEINNLLFSPIQSVACIRSVAGCVRANHYHLTDSHYSYVVSGRVLYYERPVGSSHIPSPVVIDADNMFYTPPMREHAMVFPVETVFLTFAPKIRDHQNHEQDVRRVEFITPDVLERILSSS